MASRRNIRILVADDHLPVRVGLKLALEAEKDLKVVAEAEDGDEALRRALAEEVDLALLDISMPGLTGIEVAQELSRRKPAVRTLILSMHDDDDYVSQALSAGAAGYVLKSAADRELVAACRATARGEPWLYPGAIKALTRDHVDRAKKGGWLSAEPLSPRQSEVLKLTAQRRTTSEIAEILMISQRTVERERGKILAKLQMTDRAELIDYAIRRGLVKP
jgi:DNA-binding NarL/FixJ family response regulator